MNMAVTIMVRIWMARDVSAHTPFHCATELHTLVSNCHAKALLTCACCIDHCALAPASHTLCCHLSLLHGELVCMAEVQQAESVSAMCDAFDRLQSRAACSTIAEYCRTWFCI